MRRLITFTAGALFLAAGATAQISNQVTAAQSAKDRPSPQHDKTGESEELIELRNAHERVFQNADGSLTRAQSSTPLHYLDEEGRWQSLDYSLAPAAGLASTYHYPAQRPRIAIDAANGSLQFFDDVADDEKPRAMYRVLSRSQKVINAYGEVLPGSEVPAKWESPVIEADRVLIPNVFEYSSFELELGKGHLKTSYILEAEPLMDPDAAFLLYQERVELPQDWSIRPMPGESDASIQGHEQLGLYNAKGELKSIFARPVYSDASQQEPEDLTLNGHSRPGPKGIEADREDALFFGSYLLEKEADGTYSIGMYVPAEWLKENRVYPVVIDPVVVFTDDTPLNTCFFPNYESGSSVVSVPAGDIVTATYLEWEFVATSGTSAWMADQRSYIEGPAGTTSVFSGTGNTAGTQQYSTTAAIANGVSSGSVEYVWYASRVWGNESSGCNATFNFISQRYIEVTYFDELEVGEGDILVNEYTASNRFVSDQFGNYEDLVELYNNSSNFVDIGGYYLSDNPNNPTKWEFPPFLIPPGGFLTVYCSGRDGLVNGEMHAGFRLSQLDDEYVILSNPAGEVLESYPLWITQNGHSYGRVFDGAEEWGVSPSPTIGSSNGMHFEGYTSTPQISMEAGYYPGAISVSITAEPGEDIRYTTNGNEPTASSPLYTGSINISETTVLRARAFDPSNLKLPGFMETNTYFINDNSSLPVFSFSGDLLPTLFGGTQIEPLGAVEFFDADGQLIDESYCDFNKHGNDSWSYPQRGVDFISRDEFGYNDELRHTFFPTKERGEFQRLMVKAAANDNYPFESGGAHIRDSYIQSFSQLTDLELDERSSLNCLVYVNGEYWGVYDLREKVDDNDFTRFYYDQRRKYKGSEEYVQFLKTWGGTQAKYGEQRAINDWNSIRNFVLQNDMGDESNYQIAEEALDFTSIIDHFVSNSFIVSRDWLNYNTGWWRGLDPSGEAQKWRYIMWDMEAAFGHYTNWTGLPNPGVTAPPCQAENLTVGNGHAQMLKKLIDENPEMRRRYVTRYIDLLNTKFSEENLLHVLDSMVAVIAPEMPRQINRWGGNVAQWEANVETLRDWISDRCDFMVGGLADCYDLTGPYDITFQVEPAGSGRIKMNSEWLNEDMFEAFLYGNIETILEPEGIGPYQFSHWEVSNHTFESLSDSVLIQVLFSDDATVTAHFFNDDDSQLTETFALHYWHFNQLDGEPLSILADSSIVPIGSISYPGSGDGYMDDVNDGSSLNLLYEEEPGRGLRVRNPSDKRHLLIEAPTTGYENIKLQYAVKRTNNGATQQTISYRTEEEGGFTVFDSLTVTTDYLLQEFDFSAISEVADNPHFAVRIDFGGENASGSSGNNRFDNISFTGTLPGEELLSYLALAQEDFAFNAWPASSTAGFYPDFMRFHWSLNPSSAEYDVFADATGLYDCSYDKTNRPRFIGLGDDGFAFLTTGNPQFNDCNSGDASPGRYVGSASIALNTEGVAVATAQWVAGIVTEGARQFAVRLQYRLGNTGPYMDVDAPTVYSSEGKTEGHSEQFNISLPAELLGQPTLQLRFVYYQEAGESGNRPQMRIDDVLITATDLTGECLADGGTLEAAGTRSFCVGTGTPQAISVQAVGATGIFQRWGLVNAAGDVLEVRTNNSLFNLDAYPPGNYSIRYIRFESDVSLSALAAISNISQINQLEGCFGVSSNAINLFLRDEPDGGTLTASSPTTVCADSGPASVVQLSVSGNTGENGGFGLVAQGSLDLLAINTTGNFNMNGFAPGIYLARHMSYQQGVNLSGITQVNQVSGCFDFSNIVNINVAACLQATLTASPNPTSDISRVRYSVPEDGYTLLEVYDLSGRRVSRLWEGQSVGGQEYSHDFNASKLPNGVYVIRLHTKDDVLLHKLVLGR